SNAFAAGLIALVISETAYMAEIHRGGLLAIHKGQIEAGRALGLSFLGIQRLIVVPQAIRVSLPAMSNELVTIVKPVPDTHLML
ncbi:ABC transporter permease subunit, partial [Klebsiella quasipneumoniae]|uniref:ABC transporter permease subunit n=1 Tax=Klebsiella quasipneumoniae TaxID=1463165 RepID=UPI0011B67095